MYRDRHTGIVLLVESYGCWETDHARQQELLGAGVGMLVEIATGVQLDVALSGDESADPLLMVCATSLSYRSWGPLAEALAESFRLIRYDHRGIGSSERGHGSIWMASLAADAAALLDALQVQRAHVLGWSLGSAVAQELALAYPNRMGALVLWSTWAATDVYQYALMTALRYPWATGDVTTAITAGSIAFSPEFLNSSEFWPMMRRRRPVQPQTKGQIRATVQQWDANLAHDTADRLENVTAPTLVVAGEQDVITPPRLGQAVAELIPGARLKLFTGPGSSHALGLERAAEFIPLVIDFFSYHALTPTDP